MTSYSLVAMIIMGCLRTFHHMLIECCFLELHITPIADAILGGDNQLVEFCYRDGIKRWTNPCQRDIFEDDVDQRNRGANGLAYQAEQYVWIMLICSHRIGLRYKAVQNLWQRCCHIRMLQLSRYCAVTQSPKAGAIGFGLHFYFAGGYSWIIGLPQRQDVSWTKLHSTKYCKSKFKCCDEPTNVVWHAAV